VGVNYMEIYQRTGLYKVAPPFTPGTEAAGTVEAVGPGVTTVKPGDRVGSANMLGAYAEYSLASAERLVPLPDRVTTRKAAAILLQGMTAHYLTTSTYQLSRGQTCLVHAAAGGVGLLLTQIAKGRGARVIGTTSTDEKARLAREAGADEVIGYDGFSERVRDLTGGDGVAAVYDGVARATFDQSLASLRRRGTLVLYGSASGAVPPFDPMRLQGAGSVYLTRPTLRDYTATRDELLARAGEVLAWVAAGELEVRIGARYPLEDAARAQEDLESRRTTGKLLLTV
jgi:NADPH:quinone reductase